MTRGRHAPFLTYEYQVINYHEYYAGVKKTQHAAILI